MPSETASPSNKSESSSSGGGVFSWLHSSTRSPPKYGTTSGELSSDDLPLPLTIRTSATRSNNSSVASGSPSSRSSASRSPASRTTKTKRRFIIPQGAASPGGRFGPMVTFDISTRTKTATVKSTDLSVDDEIALIEREYASSSPSSRTTTTYTTSKTMKKDEQVPSEDNQTLEYITTTVRSPVTAKQFVFTSTGNQEEHLPLEEKAEYVTKTIESPASQHTVRYVTTTTTTSSQTDSPVAMGQPGKVTYVTTTQPQQQQQNVQYVTETIAGEPQQQQQQHVHYVTKTTTHPQQQRNVVTTHTTGNASPHQHVHYVTSTTAQPPTLAPAHHIQYVTSSHPAPLQSNQQVQTNHQVWTVPGHQHQVQYVSRSPTAQQQQQKVQYVTTKTITPGQSEQVQIQSQPQVQYITTTKTIDGSGYNNGVDGSGSMTAHGSMNSIESMTMTASTTSTGSARTIVESGVALAPPAIQIKLVDGVEGLPPPHFIGVHRPASDAASSDGEDPDVELIFDIMAQKFKPVRKGIVKRKTKVVGSNVSSTGSYRSATASGSGSTKSGSAAVIVAGLGVGTARSAATATGGSGVGVTSGSGADVATGSGAAVGSGSGAAFIQVSAASDLEGKGPIPSDNSKAGAAVGLGVGVGAAAVEALRSSPMMKLDTVSTPTSGKPPASTTPSDLKKRTPSQSKPSLSPRRFFSNSPSPSTPGATANPATQPDQDTALTVESPAPYAALRSPSHHDLREPDSGSNIALLLKLRVCHWFTITLLALAIIVLIMVVFYRGVTLRKYQGSELATYQERYDVADNFNGYMALFTTFFSTPIEWLVAVVLPMVFLSVLATALLRAKLSPRIRFAFFSISWFVSYLLSSGFHALNVQLRVDNIEPVITLLDLSLSLSASVNLAALAAVNMSSNASLVVEESGVGNAITNTVLRNCIVPEVEQPEDSESEDTTNTNRVLRPEHRNLAAEATSGSALLCSNRPSLDALAGFISGDVQALSTKTVATYGFPMRPWQEEMLPGALPEVNLTLDGLLGSKIPSLVVLPMTTRSAADLVLHAVHVSRDVFHWFDVASSTPLGVQDALQAKYGAYSTDETPTYVSASDLLNLTTPGANTVEDVASAGTFVSQARSLIQQSLAGAENVSATETTLDFSTVVLPSGFLFESVTLEIPLIKSFLSRQLKESGSFFIEDQDVDPETAKTVYYDLDVANDCGPYTGLCEVRKTEFDAQGNVYEPPTTVRAFALCTNSQGTDELEVVVDGAAYSCAGGESKTSMLVVSVSSRIVGDALVDAPSTTIPRLVDGMATIVNPRKIYSLTVGKLSWSQVNLALKFNAACAAGVGKCTGLEYALGAALKNATEVLKDVVGNLRGSVDESADESEDEDKKHLIVGADFVPLRWLSVFKYNATEVDSEPRSSVSGWPLVTITKPLQVDTGFENDGDLVAPSNFKLVSWKKTPRATTQCSATVEARLASVLNNHLYIERGVQPAYTSALFFLFQDAVTKAEVALAASVGGLTTLTFAQNIEFISLHASIPLLNVVLTGVGCGVILLAALFVFVVLGKGTRRYGIVTDSPSEGGAGGGFLVPSEGVARVKLDRQLFPRIVLSRRIEDARAPPAQEGGPATKVAPGQEQNDDVDTFTVDTMGLEQDDRDHAVATGLAK